MFTTDADVIAHREDIAHRTAGRHAHPGHTLSVARDPERTGAPRHAATVPTPRDAWADDPDRTTRRDTYAY